MGEGLFSKSADYGSSAASTMDCLSYLNSPAEFSQNIRLSDDVRLLILKHR